MAGRWRSAGIRALIVLYAAQILVGAANFWFDFAQPVRVTHLVLGGGGLGDRHSAVGDVEAPRRERNGPGTSVTKVMSGADSWGQLGVSARGYAPVPYLLRRVPKNCGPPAGPVDSSGTGEANRAERIKTSDRHCN